MIWLVKNINIDASNLFYVTSHDGHDVKKYDMVRQMTALMHRIYNMVRQMTVVMHQLSDMVRQITALMHQMYDMVRH